MIDLFKKTTDCRVLVPTTEVRNLDSQYSTSSLIKYYLSRKVDIQIVSQKSGGEGELNGGEEAEVYEGEKGIEGKNGRAEKWLRDGGLLALLYTEGKMVNNATFMSSIMRMASNFLTT